MAIGHDPGLMCNDSRNPDRNGSMRISEERRRQRNQEGFTMGHDAEHGEFELTRAAICYANQATQMGQVARADIPAEWPWEDEWWKPEPRKPTVPTRIRRDDAIRMLEKAGALIAAEIDRLLRLKK